MLASTSVKQLTALALLKAEEGDGAVGIRWPFGSAGPGKERPRWPAGSECWWAALLPLLLLFFSFLQTENKTEKHSNNGEGGERYENIAGVQNLCRILINCLGNI